MSFAKHSLLSKAESTGLSGCNSRQVVINQPGDAGLGKVRMGPVNKAGSRRRMHFDRPRTRHYRGTRSSCLCRAACRPKALGSLWSRDRAREKESTESEGRPSRLRMRRWLIQAAALLGLRSRALSEQPRASISFPSLRRQAALLFQ